MESLQLSKLELHVIAICYLDYIKMHPSDDIPSQEDREAIGKKLAAFLNQLPTDAKITLSEEL